MNVKTGFHVKSSGLYLYIIACWYRVWRRNQYWYVFPSCSTFFYFYLSPIL